MKLNKYLTLGIGMVAGFGVSLAGLSYASSNHSNLITSEKAKTIMLNKVPGATITEFSYDRDDRVPKYDGTLIKGNYEYEVDVNAKTGKIVKFEEEKIVVSNSNTKKVITAQKAKSIMMNKVPGATITEFSYDGDDRIPKYEGTLKKDNYEYEIDVNATTGEIIKFEKEKISTSNNNNSSNNQQNTTKPGSTQNNTSNNTSSNTQSNSFIGAAKAKSIMLSKVPGATIKSFHFDNDRTPEYEGELIKGNMEYEISVDARTGKITEFSKERIDKYDDNDRYDDDDDDDRYDDDHDDDDDDDDDDRYDD